MRVVLALIALILVAVLAFQWGDWPPSRSVGDMGSAQSAAEGATQGPQSPLELLDTPAVKEDYAVVIERPLFMPDRRPPVEGEEEVEEEPQPIADTELRRMDLSAVVITPAESTAWVRDPAKPELLKVRHGDDLEGWTVKEIRNDEIELERQGETDTLVLRDYQNSPPPVARPQPPRRATRQPARTTTTHGGDRSVPANRPNTPPRTGAGRP